MTPLWSDKVEQRVRDNARSLDEQERPDDVRFCKRCVISNQRPRIVFDGDGVCSACRFAEHKRDGIDWNARNRELETLLDRHRLPRGYDCIVPCSGGKDSAYVAHKLKTVYGMNPLCVKWAPFMYTDIGFKNFNAFVHSGFDVIVGWPNGLIHRKLARLCFEFYGDPFQPFVFGQLAFPMQMAEKHGIGLVFYGENGEAEYGGDPAANDKPCWGAEDWERVYLKGAAVDAIVDLGVQMGAFSEDERRYVSEFYHLPDRPCQTLYPEFHWFSYYRRWHPQSNYYYACENTGFEANDERSEGTYSKYASIDDKMDGLHYFMAYLKFGLGRASSDAAHEIRDGDITREEAVALVKKYDGEPPMRYLPECMEYLGLTDDAHCWTIANRFRSDRIWSTGLGENGLSWVLNDRVYE